MSKSFFNEHDILHDLPRYKVHTKNLEIGNSTYISIKFITPLFISSNGHVFEIFALVNSSKTNELLLMGMKNLVEMEGVLCTRTMTPKFLNHSAPVFPQENFILQPNEDRTVKLDIAFPSELNGIVVMSMVQHLKFPVGIKTSIKRNKTVLILENNCSYSLTFKRDLPIGIIDARSLGHFHCQNKNLTKTLLTNYYIISAHHIQTVMM